MIRDHVVNRRMFDEILASLESSLPENDSRALEAASLSSLATRHINVAAMAEVAPEGQRKPPVARLYSVIFPRRA